MSSFSTLASARAHLNTLKGGVTKSAVPPVTKKVAQPKKVSIDFHGYLQGDVFGFSSPDLHSGSHWRGGRMTLDFNFPDSITFQVQREFAQDQWQNVAFFIDALKHWYFSVGQFQPTWGLSSTTDTPLITFLELSLPIYTFAPAYNLGFGVQYYYSPFTINASLTRPGIGISYQGPQMPYTATAGFSYSPWHTLHRALHLGFTAWQQGVDSGHTASFSTVPEIYNNTGQTLIGTPVISNVSYYTAVNGSFADVSGPFTIQSEYVHTWVARNSGLPTLQYDGYYVTASYFLTGESRVYSFRDACFVGISPILHSYGAWQLALRFSDVNLNDQRVIGGQEHNVTVGLNWYPVKHLEFYLNYVRIMAQLPTNVWQDSNAYAFRMQVMW